MVHSFLPPSSVWATSRVTVSFDPTGLVTPGLLPLSLSFPTPLPTSTISTPPGTVPLKFPLGCCTALPLFQDLRPVPN